MANTQSIYTKEQLRKIAVTAIRERKAFVPEVQGSGLDWALRITNERIQLVVPYYYQGERKEHTVAL